MDPLEIARWLVRATEDRAVVWVSYDEVAGSSVDRVLDMASYTVERRSSYASEVG